MATFLTREAARAPRSTRPLAMAVLWHRLVVAMIASLLMTAAYWVASSDRSLVVPALFAVSVVASPVYGTVHAAQRASGEVRFDAANEVLSRVLVLLLAFAMIGRGDLLLAVGILAGADLLSAFAHIPLLFTLSTGEAPARLALSEVAPIGISTALGAVIQRIDVWLVVLVVSPIAGGVYGATRKLSDGLGLVGQSFGVLALAPLARKPPAQRERLFLLMLVSATGVALAFAAVPLSAPHRVLNLVFGPAFAGAAGTLRLVVLAGCASASLGVALSAINITNPSRGPVRLSIATVLLVVPTLLGAIAHDAVGGAGGFLVGSIGATILLAWSARLDLRRGR